MAVSIGASSALATIYYLYPATVFAFFSIASVVAACTLQSRHDDRRISPIHPGRRAYFRFLAFFVATYAAQITATCIQAAVDKVWAAEEHVVISRFSCFLVFGIQLSRLFDVEPPTAMLPLQGSAFLSLVFEVTIAAWSVALIDQKATGYPMFDLSLTVVRCLSLFVMTVWTFIRFCVASASSASDEERESLLPKNDDPQGTTVANGNQTTPPTGYGAAQRGNQSAQGNANGEVEYSWERRRREAREAMEKRLKQGGNWFQYAKGFMVCFVA
jgi:hypothetical protein